MNEHCDPDRQLSRMVLAYCLLVAWLLAAGPGSAAFAQGVPRPNAQGD